MHLKSTKKLSFQAIKIAKDFTSDHLTRYSGLTVVNDYATHLGLFEKLNKQFITHLKSATQILNVQIFSGILFANICGIYHLNKISEFMKDTLVSKLLHLKRGFEDSNLKSRLKQLGERGSHDLLEMGLRLTNRWVSKCGLSRITIDCDSTEETVYGHQEGASKGYNPHNKGKKCYHPLICFCSEMKIVLNSWFRPGNTYTANGHEYLVKAKLTKPIKLLLSGQNWVTVDSHTAICEFEYKAWGWSKLRKMCAVRIVKKYVKKEWLGTVEYLPVYDYFCYCTNLKGLESKKIHALYGGRTECENWIENVKNQLCAGKTITNDFHVNDMLWQLSIIAYNLSVLMRYESDFKTWRQEPKTFREWFISVPGKVVTNGRKTIVKMSKQYIYAKAWERLANKIPIAA
jgi:hypothetical protein